MNTNTAKVTSILNVAICILDNKMYSWLYHGENERDFGFILKKALVYL